MSPSEEIPAYMAVGMRLRISGGSCKFLDPSSNGIRIAILHPPKLGSNPFSPGKVGDHRNQSPIVLMAAQHGPATSDHVIEEVSSQSE